MRYRCGATTIKHDGRDDDERRDVMCEDRVWRGLSYIVSNEVQALNPQSGSMSIIFNNLKSQLSDFYY